MEHRGNASDDHQVPPYYQANQTPVPIFPAPPQQHHHHHHHPNPPQITQLDHKLQQFWAKQTEEALVATDFKAHGLPLARIKKIMKSEEKVKMVGSEVPVIFAKACEMFIQELTLRSWDHTEEKKRRTLQRSDIAAAVEKTDVFDFLVDFVPRERPIEEVFQIKQGAGGDFGPCPCEGTSRAYIPPPPPPPPPAFVGNPAVNVYQPVWPQQPPPPPPRSFVENPVVNVHHATQSRVAPPMWPQPPPPFVENPAVNVQNAAQSYFARPMWPQPPPPPPPFVENPASQSYIARPMWPQKPPPPPPPPPYASGSYKQG